MPVINRDNYELFFIDYFDGKLSKSEVEKLFSFLLSNPDLKIEFEEFEEEICLPEKIAFSRKSSLIKDPVLGNYKSDNFSALCIARIEKDLSLKEQAEFDTLIETNSELKKEFSLFEKTILFPDSSIVFNKKTTLRKSVFEKPFKRKYQFLSIAASIIILMVLTLFIPKSLQEDSNTDEQTSLIHKEKKEAFIPKEITVITKPKIQEKEKSSFAQIQNNLAGEPVSESFQAEQEIRPKEEEINLLKSSPISLSQNKINVSDPILIEQEQIDSKLIIASNIEESLSIKDALVRGLNKKVFKKDTDLSKIKRWDLAELAINGFNKLTGTNMSLNKKYDSEGKIKELEFNSRLIAFSTPVKE